ncbi:MAG: AbrB/MazE/SpoVT family DNA-binding domain-containing protein [Pseudoflavonifractor sp.]|nr:AbrB/MazE/SpoVT family DNA-binding domain-containing protein [Pseudoflavonifractor sp.]
MDSAPKFLEGKYMTTVKVGPKGQIVIPKEARDLYGVQPGDSIMLLVDRRRGIALQRMEDCKELFSKVFSQHPELK